MAKAITYVFAVALLLTAASDRSAFALEDEAIYKHSLWQIAGKGGMKRWLIIRNLESAQQEGVFHIEVIGQEKGKPIARLSKHMAITLAALKRSVTKPLKSGDVYPEQYDGAFAAWQDTDAAKRPVCDTSVVECLASAK